VQHQNNIFKTYNITLIQIVSPYKELPNKVQKYGVPEFHYIEVCVN